MVKRVQHQSMIVQYSLGRTSLFTPAVTRPGWTAASKCAAVRVDKPFPSWPSAVNLHIPPDLSWHQRPSAQEALISHLCARAAAAARPAAAHRTPRRAQSERE